MLSICSTNVFWTFRCSYLCCKSDQYCMSQTYAEYMMSLKFSMFTCICITCADCIIVHVQSSPNMCTAYAICVWIILCFRTYAQHMLKIMNQSSLIVYALHMFSLYSSSVSFRLLDSSTAFSTLLLVCLIQPSLSVFCICKTYALLQFLLLMISMKRPGIKLAKKTETWC